MVREPHSYGMPFRLLAFDLRDMIRQDTLWVVSADYEEQVLNIVAAKALKQCFLQFGGQVVFAEFTKSTGNEEHGVRTGPTHIPIKCLTRVVNCTGAQYNSTLGLAL